MRAGYAQLPLDSDCVSTSPKIRVTSCDLGIFVDQAAEPIPAQDPDIRVT